MKKRIIIIIIVVIVCLGAYLGYKAHLLNKYKFDEVKVDTSLIFKDSIEIKKTDEVIDTI